MTRRILLAVSIALFTALPARAAEAEEDYVRAAIIELAQAARAGDATRLRQSIWIPEHSGAARNAAHALADLIAAERAFERSARQRFGGSADQLSFGLDWIASRLGQSLADARVQIEGDSARLWGPGEAMPTRLRRDSAGRWRVVIDVVESETRFQGPFAPPRPRTERMLKLLSLIGDMQNRIDAGEFETAAQVSEALTPRIAEANQEFLRRQGAFMRRQPMPLPEVPE